MSDERKTQNTPESLQTSEDWFEVCQWSDQFYSQGFPTLHTVLSTWKWFWLLLTHGLALLFAFPKLISVSWIHFTAWSLTWAHICSKNKLLFEQNKKSTLLRFSQTRELYSFKAAFTIAFFAAVNNNYYHKLRTLKQRNPQNGLKSTNHRSQSWPFEPVKKNFRFLRGPPKWLTAAKNENVSWLFMRSPLSQEVTWPAATRVLSRGKRRNSRSEIVEKWNFSDVPATCNKYSQKKRSRCEMRNGYKACQISFLYFFVSLFSRTWRCTTFNDISIILLVFVFCCCCRFFFTNKDVALICSITFWTENKGLRTVKELPT